MSGRRSHARNLRRRGVPVGAPAVAPVAVPVSSRIGDAGVDAGPAGRLAQLAPAVWARLLAALRVLAVATASEAEWVALLDAPTSELAQGTGRRDLCRALAADAVVLRALVDEGHLPGDVDTAVRAALEDEATPAADGATARGGAEDADLQTDRDRDRDRELRRELETARRQRDGAQARALAAEQRLEEAQQEMLALAARLAEHEDADESRSDETRRAVARTERRIATKVATLEAALAEERATLERVRRQGEQDRADLSAVTSELVTLRAELASLAPLAEQARRDEGPRPLRLPPTLDPLTTRGARWLLDRADEVLLDGYNITLTQRPGEELEAQRRWLVDRVRALAVRGACRPTIVFDGDRPHGTLTRTAGVDVRFSGSAVTADDEIVFAVAATSRPVIVVTDDRELIERVHAEGGNVLAPVAFLAALEP